MRVNANYTWLKCLECGDIAKILPGQKFENSEALAKTYECGCTKVKQKTKGKQNAT